MKKIAFLSLLFSFLLFACNGQVESARTDSVKITDATKAAAITDSNFYIEGQLCQHLRKIFEDSKGNLWFGTNVYDLMRYDGDTLVYISEKEGFSGGRVTGIVEDHTGNIWFATGEGLSKYDGQSFTVFTTKDGLPSDELWSLYLNSEGIFWIGHNGGLSRFDGTAFENIAIPKAPIKNPNSIYVADRITSIAADKKGNLWLGTDGFGICKYNGETFVHYTTSDGLCDNTVGELMVDRHDNLWIGTFFGGVSKFDGTTFTNFTQNGTITGEEVGAFFEDTNGDIWFGAENNGVYKYNGNSFTHYFKEEGLDGIVLSIYRDRKDRFWFGGWGGLFRFYGETFVSVTREGTWE